MGSVSSRLPEFYKKFCAERQNLVQELVGMSDEDMVALTKTFALSDVDKLIENAIGTIQIPVGVATNFCIDGCDVLVPMATEENSIVAAASYAAKLARDGGGFYTQVSEQLMIGQIQLINVHNHAQVQKIIEGHKKELLALANQAVPSLKNKKKGALDLNVRNLQTQNGTMVIVHVLVDTCDAMGANIVNKMVEALAPELERITGARCLLKIVSNLAIHRLVSARAIWKKELLGSEVIEDILLADAFARADMYRGVTHNKGIMNGIDAVALATGNDFRALEAGVHGFAALDNSYKPLTNYYKSESGDLVGEITLPIAVGIVGGATQINPGARVCLKILGVKSASELARIMAAVGLAQNFAALHALVTTGIQTGYTKCRVREFYTTKALVS